MSWSLAEIEALSKKAARGGGMAWGLAEEAGKASRWLCAAGFAGAEVLADLLTCHDGVTYGDLCPSGGDGAWQAEKDALCPIVTGATLCDSAAELAMGRVIELGRTAYPLLLVPFVVGAADITGTTLAVSWPGITITRSQGDTHYKIDQQTSLMIPVAAHMRIGLADTLQGAAIKRAYRGHIAPETANILATFAHRTYAPDTPESRITGAGAGLTDND